MRLFRRKRPRPSLMETGIQVRIGGQVLLGPMTLEALALTAKYGGYGDLLADCLVAEGQPRTEIILHPPP